MTTANIPRRLIKKAKDFKYFQTNYHPRFLYNYGSDNEEIKFYYCNKDEENRFRNIYIFSRQPGSEAYALLYHRIDYGLDTKLENTIPIPFLSEQAFSYYNIFITNCKMLLKEASSTMDYAESNKYMTCLAFDLFLENIKKINEHLNSLQISPKNKQEIHKLFIEYQNSSPGSGIQDLYINYRKAISEINPVIINTESGHEINSDNIWNLNRKNTILIPSEFFKKSNIIKRGNKVNSTQNFTAHLVKQEQNPPNPTNSSYDFINLHEEKEKNLYFHFIHQAFLLNKSRYEDFCYSDIINALAIAKKFGGVNNKLNNMGTSYEKLDFQEVKNFIDNRNPRSGDAVGFTEKKFEAIKKFSASYQKLAGDYFLSARNNRTKARLTFFPDRFLNVLKTQLNQTTPEDQKSNSSRFILRDNSQNFLK